MLFDFEDRTLQNWAVAWGSGISLSNTTAQAYSGTHSLAIQIAAQRGYPAVENTTQLSGVTPGAIVTYHLYAPTESTVQVTPFVDDGNWNETFAAARPLAAGWNTIAFTIPSVSGLNGVGFEVEIGSHWSGVLYLDTVTTSVTTSPVPTPASTASPTPMPEVTSTPSPTANPTAAATATPTPDPASTSTPTPTATWIPTPTATSTAPTGAGGAVAGLHVSGSRILNGAGQLVQLHGVNRPSFEYMCVSGGGMSEGPMNQAEIDAMKSWHINAVRVVLNEDCWLGIHGVNPAYSGANYQNAIANYVSLLTNNNIAAIVNLHFNGDGTSLAVDQEPMADQAHSPAFWTSVANRFKGNSAVLFEPYNEPHDIDWTCWRNGGSCAGVSFTVAGMQEMVNAIRGTGATNIIIATGINWGSNLDQWTQYEPADPLNQLAAGWHTYNDGLDCASATCWNTTLAALLNNAPIVATEIGEFTCAHSYIDQVTTFLDLMGQGYTAWAWTPGDCASEPALVADWKGTPTQTYGQGYQDHLRLNFPQAALRH